MSASVCVLCAVLGPWIHVLAVPGRRRPGRDGRSLVNPKRPLRRPNFPNRLASSRTCHAMRCHDPTSNSVWFNREDADLAGSWLGERVPSMVRSQTFAHQHAASCSSSLQSRHTDLFSPRPPWLGTVRHEAMGPRRLPVKPNPPTSTVPAPAEAQKARLSAAATTPSLVICLSRVSCVPFEGQRQSASDVIDLGTTPPKAPRDCNCPTSMPRVSQVTDAGPDWTVNSDGQQQCEGAVPSDIDQGMAPWALHARLTSTRTSAKEQDAPFPTAQDLEAARAMSREPNMPPCHRRVEPLHVGSSTSSRDPCRPAAPTVEIFGNLLSEPISGHSRSRQQLAVRSPVVRSSTSRGDIQCDAAPLHECLPCRC